MALNLWRVGGQPTSFTPMSPSGIFYTTNVDIAKTYIISFKAKSNSGGRLRLTHQGGTPEFSYYINLTPDFQQFKYEYSFNKSWVGLNNPDGASDIHIKDIELVEKPLGTATINGIEGFLSGKWSSPFPSSFSIIDDETAQLTEPVGENINFYINVTVEPNTVYSVNCDTNGKIGIYNEDASSSIKSYAVPPFSFNTGDNSGIRVYFGNRDLGAGTFIFKKPTFNKGATPAPYEKKIGERMVMPVFNEDGSVQLNPKRKRSVPNKNYIRGEKDGIKLLFNEGEGSYSYENVWEDGKLKVMNGSTDVHSRGQYVNVKPNVPYTLSMKALNASDGALARIIIGSSGTASEFTSTYFPVTESPFIFTPTVDRICIRFIRNGLSNQNAPAYFWDIQLEEGSIQTEYEPYQEVAIPAKTGLKFNGSEHIAIDHGSYDTVDVEFDFTVHNFNGSSYQMIWASQIQTANYFGIRLSDRALFTSVRTNVGQRTFDSDFVVEVGMRYKGRYTYDGEYHRMYVEGELVKEQLVNEPMDTTYSETGSLIGKYAGGYPFQGVIHSIKFNDVFNYDFTNPTQFVGDKFIPNAKNLIPSFEDERWNIHANARVYGENVLRLDTTVKYSNSYIDLYLEPNVNYSSLVNEPSYLRVYDGHIVDAGKSLLNGVTGVFTPTQSKVRFLLTNGNTSAGVFDFIKPQLYKLTGNEATITGAPASQLKSAKRVLYARR